MLHRIRDALGRVGKFKHYFKEICSVTIDPNHYYSPADLGKLLGVGAKSIAIKCKRGEIKSACIARRLIIPGAAAIEYLQAAAKLSTFKNGER
jgi:hypothetical protein